MGHGLCERDGQSIYHIKDLKNGSMKPVSGFWDVPSDLFELPVDGDLNNKNGLL
jgi:hypothetical protein